MTSHAITVNGTRHVVDADGNTPLLWILRDILGLTGTKYGCGEGTCGACTVLEGDEPVRSCQIDFDDAAGLSYTTIEGLSEKGDHSCQQAWIEENVSQCGYCQAGILLKVSSLLGREPRPTDAEIDGALSDDDSSLPDDSRAEVWTLAGEPGQTLVVELISQSFDALLMRVPPEGGRYEMDDDSAGNCNSRIWVTFEGSEPHLIVVNSLGPDGRGGFTLRVSDQAGPEAPGAC